MKFKHYLHLRRRAVSELVARAADPRTPVARPTATPDARSYAYLGDAVYSLYVRRRLLETGITSTRVLHDLAARIVSAKAQSRVLLALDGALTDEERIFCRHARNADVPIPASATAGEYHRSTAWEALLGYYAWRGEETRIDTLLAAAWQIIVGELAHETI